MNINNLKTLIKKSIPTFFTTLNLFFGLSGILFALNNDFRTAVYCILIAALSDGFDGRLARWLKTTSRIGAEMDSFADLATFGIAAPLIVFLYLGINYTINQTFVWGLVLLFVACTAFRLARFNVVETKPQKEYWKNFFIGLPSPGAAILTLVPLFLIFQKIEIQSPIIFYVFLTIPSILMISNIPTLSIKKMKFQDFMLMVLSMFLLFVLGHFTLEVWLVLLVFSALYLISIPLSSILFLHAKRKYK